MLNENPALTATLPTSAGVVSYVPIAAAVERAGGDVERLPVTVRILAESLLRRGDPDGDPESALRRLVAASTQPREAGRVVSFFPTRVLMQDHSGVPALLDIAAVRDELAQRGVPPRRADPVVPVDLVIDHSIEVQVSGAPDALRRNIDHEYTHNAERYQFLRWAQGAMAGLRVVTPGRGIVHQVHLEHLARVVTLANGATAPLAYPDTVVGTDSHTPMVNALGVLGFGVGGIEAEAVLLGQPVGIGLPEVVGVRVLGRPNPGVTATDLVLTLTEQLRAHGVVGSFLEFFGDDLDGLPIHDRATLANMSPEYGATCAMFPIDRQTLAYLTATGRGAAPVDLVERYARAQGMFRTAGAEPAFATVVEFDLTQVQTCMAGPRLPQDRVPLAQVPASFRRAVPGAGSGTGPETSPTGLIDGDVVIAAITSCTNTSNPVSMLTAGLLARNAVRRGLTTRPWVKTSLAPGSRVVTRYLEAAGLMPYLERLGFQPVGYGCTTCIGNSGPLRPRVSTAIAERDLATVAVLSGNRNFEGRIHPDVRAVYLASPPLVVASAIAGSILRNLAREPLSTDTAGVPVTLAELWPDPAEVADLLSQTMDQRLFAEEYASVFEGDERWLALDPPSGDLFTWNGGSTYLRPPPFLSAQCRAPAGDLHGARVLVLPHGTVTTDHISPAGPIPADSPAGEYLRECGVAAGDLGTYGGRRGNFEVLARGTFANPRLRNELTPDRTGGWTRHLPSGEVMPVYAAAVRYSQEQVPLLVLAGADYGMGSSRDWAAKGPRLLGVRAVLARSFERIHRSNLVGLGILPLRFQPDESAEALGLDGTEEYDVLGVADLTAGGSLRVSTRTAAGGRREFTVDACVDSARELDCLRHGGILPMAVARLVDPIEGAHR